MTQPTTPAPVDPALTQRVHAALRAVGEGDIDPGTGNDYGDQTAAVLAELAPELARAERLEAEVASVEETAADRYQNALHWQERAERPETALTRARELADRWDRYGTRDLKRYADILRTALTGPAEENTP